MSFLSGLTSALGTIGNIITPGIGSIISGGLSLLGGSNQNSANSAQALQQEQFQQGMSDTAYQRATADMRAAGLNPAIAYSQGGASTPSGASAPMNNIIGGAASSAVQAYSVAKQMENVSADTQLKKAQAIATLHPPIPSKAGWLNDTLGTEIVNSAKSAFHSLQNTVHESSIPSSISKWGRSHGLPW